MYDFDSGVIGTDLSRHITEKHPWLMHFKPMIDFMIKTPEEGAQTTIYCATEDKIECESGNYYADCCGKEPTQFAKDMEAAKRLWEESEKLINSGSA